MGVSRDGYPPFVAKSTTKSPCLRGGRLLPRPRLVNGRLESTARLPPDQRRAPGEAAAHRLEHHQIAALDAAIGDRVGERQRNRCGRGVAVAVERKHDLFGRKAELASDAVDDPLVGLMRHEPVDVVRLEAGLLEGSLNRFRYRADRKTEDLAAVHAQMADGLRRRRT